MSFQMDGKVDMLDVSTCAIYVCCALKSKTVFQRVNDLDGVLGNPLI
jgi:hypothetical protein